MRGRMGADRKRGAPRALQRGARKLQRWDVQQKAALVLAPTAGQGCGPTPPSSGEAQPDGEVSAAHGDRDGFGQNWPRAAPSFVVAEDTGHRGGVALAAPGVVAPRRLRPVVPTAVAGDVAAATAPQLQSPPVPAMPMLRARCLEVPQSPGDPAPPRPVRARATRPQLRVSADCRSPSPSLDGHDRGDESVLMTLVASASQTLSPPAPRPRAAAGSAVTSPRVTQMVASTLVASAATGSPWRDSQNALASLESDATNGCLLGTFAALSPSQVGGGGLSQARATAVTPRALHHAASQHAHPVSQSPDMDWLGRAADAVGAPPTATVPCIAAALPMRTSVALRYRQCGIVDVHPWQVCRCGMVTVMVQWGGADGVCDASLCACACACACARV
jgi:hypothetical protein